MITGRSTTRTRTTRRDEASSAEQKAPRSDRSRELLSPPPLIFSHAASIGPAGRRWADAGRHRDELRRRYGGRSEYPALPQSASVMTGMSRRVNGKMFPCVHLRLRPRFSRLSHRHIPRDELARASAIVLACMHRTYPGSVGAASHCARRSKKISF